MVENQATIGIDIGGTGIKCGVCLGSEVIDRQPVIASSDFPSADSLIAAMIEEIRTLREKYPNCAAIGVGVPGFVDNNTGTVSTATNLVGWENIPLADILSAQCGLATTVENDANCAAWAEWRFGAGVGMQNLLVVTLGTGVGAGLIIAGQLWRGSGGIAGELGQMSIHWHGRDGSYANLGAVEKYVGSRAIVEQANQAIVTNCDGEQSPPFRDTQHLAAAALARDSRAITAWHTVAEQLASALASAVWLIDPDMIIIGGGVAAAGEVFFTPLRQKLYSQICARLRPNFQLTPAKYGNDAGMLGAACLAHDFLVKKAT